MVSWTNRRKKTTWKQEYTKTQKAVLFCILTLTTASLCRDVLGGWGSGTGGAGVAGALLYSALTQLGLSPQLTLLIMLLVPCFMLVR